MKKTFFLIIFLSSFNLFAQVQLEQNLISISQEEHKGRKSNFIGEDSEAFYVLLGPLHSGDGYHIQKFDKKSNKLIYSVHHEKTSLNQIFYDNRNDYSPVYYDSSILLFYDKYNRKEKKQEVFCKKLEKESGKISPDELILSIEDEKNEKIISYSYSKNSVLVSIENHFFEKMQELQIFVYNFNDLKQKFSTLIPSNINGKDVFSYKFNLNDTGDIFFSYYELTKTKELNLFKNSELDFFYSIKHNPSSQIVEDLPHQLPKFGFIKSGETAISTININVPEPFFIDPYNICVNFENNKVIINGILKEKWTKPIDKCDAGFYSLTIDPKTKSIEKELFQPFDNKLAEELKKPSIGLDFPGMKNYHFLKSIYDKDCFYALYQMRWKLSNGYDTRLSIVAVKYSLTKNKFEWMKIVPFGIQNNALYSNIDLGITSFVYNDALYILHLDNPENKNNINDFNPFNVVPFKIKEADLVYNKIDNIGVLSKGTLFSNSDNEIVCPVSKPILLDKNKVLLYFRTENESGGYDKYGAVIVK